jgi:hypothetical protein
VLQLVAGDDALALYSVLPFDDGPGGTGAVVPPATRLLFSTYGDSPATVESFAKRCLSSGTRDPTVVLVRANGYVFGGFAAEPWDFAELFGGSTRSFLFSITRDCKVPYNGRVKGPKQVNDDVLRQQHEMRQATEQQQFMHLVAQQQPAPQFDEHGRLLFMRTDEYGRPLQQVRGCGLQWTNHARVLCQAWSFFLSFPHLPFIHPACL